MVCYKHTYIHVFTQFVVTNYCLIEILKAIFKPRYLNFKLKLEEIKNEMKF